MGEGTALEDGNSICLVLTEDVPRNAPVPEGLGASRLRHGN